MYVVVYFINPLNTQRVLIMRGYLRRTLNFERESDSVETSPLSMTNWWRVESSFLWSWRIFAGESSSTHWLWSLRMKTVSNSLLAAEDIINT